MADRSDPRVPRAIGRMALLAGGLLAAAAVMRFLPLDQEKALLGTWVIGRGWRGWGLFILAGGVLCGVGVPRQAVAFAGGYVAGVWGGVVLALPAELIGCAINLAWAGSLAAGMASPAWLRRRASGRLARLGGFLKAHPFSATLILRLLPVGNNLALNLVAGVLRVPVSSYLLASAIGYLPQTVIFALLGSGARIEQGTQIAVGVVLLVVSSVLGLVLLRRYRTMA